jgi:2-oxoglutarate ferredoxin oxidoreductase subunit alpha
MTADGISPRILPGTPGTTFVAASDEHDEAGNVISDQFTNPPLRRKMHEKRMRKIDNVLPRLQPPELEGPASADVTLVGWGSTRGVIQEAIGLLSEKGIKANHLQIKYITPFHGDQVRRILAGCSRIIVVENNISGQFARYLRSQTGIQATNQILKYDGEPFSPAFIVDRVEAILSGKTLSLQLNKAEALEIAYHYIRIHLDDAGRPVDLKKISMEAYDEAVWEIVIADRKNGDRMGVLLVGAATGATISWKPAA